jgi:ABC-type multidrug transport system fused ATPase/permease subunit
MDRFRERGWALLGPELLRRRRSLLVLAGWSTAESLPALTSGGLVAAALDRGFLMHRPLAGLGWLTALGGTIAVQAIATRGTFRPLRDLVEPLRNVLVTAVVSGALGRAVRDDGPADGAAVARLNAQAETARNLVAALLRSLRSSAISLVLALIGLFALAPVVAALTVPLVVVSLGLFAVTVRPLAARQRAMVLAGEDLARVAAETFGGVRDVVAAGAEDIATAAVDRAARREARTVTAVVRAAASRAVIVAIGGQVPLVLLLLLAPGLLRSGRLTAGDLVGAATYLVGVLDPALRSITGTVGTWGRQLSVLLDRIVETGADAGAESPSGILAARPRSADLSAAGLTFAYGPWAEPVLRDLDLRVPAGGHLAVVGPSGVGKSTLAMLLAGLAVPQAGLVKLGGTPVEELDPRTRAAEVALIPQQAYVFAGTLRENLAYLDPAADDDRLDAAVAALGLRETVERIGGYDARLGVGAPGLSAGERQLIALARVHVGDAPVVILDEATCHLDPAAEARAEAALAVGGRTLVVIAHRVSSARRAQRILVLDGLSAATGTHDELLACSPPYADLVGHWERRYPRADASLARTTAASGSSSASRMSAAWLQASSAASGSPREPSESPR